MLLLETFWSQLQNPQHDEYSVIAIKDLDLGHANECTFIGRLFWSALQEVVKLRGIDMMQEPTLASG